MAEIHDFRESAEKLGRAIREPQQPEPPEAEEVALQPPGVFSSVESTQLGVWKTLTKVEIHAVAPELPELEM